MNDTYTNATLSALEGQRNVALNDLVKTKAMLAVATERVQELEAAKAAASIDRPAKPEEPTPA